MGDAAASRPLHHWPAAAAAAPGVAVLGDTARRGFIRRACPERT